jgi:hypothetical protein
MKEPFGLQIVMGLVVGQRFRTGALIVQKVSCTAGVGNSGGGNKRRIGRQGRTYRLRDKGRRRKQAIEAILLPSLPSIGFPCCHS